MAQKLPITLKPVFDLVSMGVNPQFIKFDCTTLESDKFVCVREQAPDGSSGQISIFDTSMPHQPIKRPISAESAIMNPVAKVIALKNGTQMQIFNIELKSKMKAHNMPEPVVFWKWISPSVIALVTANAVFHWTMDGDSAPSKIFDRHASLAACQIINYKADDKISWCCLTGISKTPDGRIGGSMQLFSIERQMTQTIEGHACAFVDLTLAGNTTPSTLFAFANRGAAESSINIIEVAKAAGPPETTVAFGKRKLTLNFPPEAAGDFPLSMSISNKYGIVVVVTKLGFVQVFETETGAFIYGNRFTEGPVFIGCSNSIGGIHCINGKGQILALGIDEANIIPFLVQGGNVEAAIKLAGRCHLPGGEDLYSGQLDALLKQGNLQGAVQAAANSPGGVLRTASTIQKFKSIQAPPNTPPPLLQYFGQLLEKKVVGPDGSMQPGKLNPLESVELARLVLSQGKGQLLQQWLTDNRLEASEELGDLLRQLQSPETYKLALKIYLDCKAHDKGINCFLDLGMIPQILVYCKRVNYNPDWTPILTNVLMRNPDMAQQLAVSLFNNDGAQPLCDPQAVCELFFSRNLIQQGTAFALESLKSNQPQFAVLQTKVLEMNLRNPAGLQVADAIIQNAVFTQYDRPKIGGLCEKAGLFQRALEHYTEIEDIKRCIVQTHSINPEFLIAFFGNLSAEWGILCLKALLDSNIRTNLQLVVQIATKYVEELGVQPLVQIFNDAKSPDGMFFFLGAIVNFSQDPDVHFEYIAAAAKRGISTNDFKEVERVTRESDYYPAEKTKNFLKELKVPDIRLIVQSLVNVCDRHGFVKELTEYLFHGGQAKAIEVYVTKYNPQRTPEVVSSLIENGAGDDVVKSLVMAVRGLAPMAELIQVFEEHHKLKMLLPWLEARMDEGAQDEALHNALAKIYIDTAQNPEKFLEENRFYNSLVVGKYCETRDPHYSVICYKRGGCDDELIAVTSANGLYKAQAMYLIQRKDQDLWAKVLRSEDAEAKQLVVDQVVQVGLPESKNADEVSETVKAFMSADMPSALIELLEKIVLQGSEFGQNKNLQNLLIITAISADATRVMGYINRLDKFDATDIAEFCVTKELFEEAVVIYKRNKMIVPAVNVLIENLKDLERGLEFAKTVDDHEVWSCLARAQLFANRIGDAVDSFIKADDAQSFEVVINMGQQNETWPELIKFLTMARKKVKDQRIDTCMAWSFCKINQLANLEEFITAPNIAQILVVGERAYDQGLYEAARILFNHISNFGKLASTLVRLAKYSDAVEAARKANYSRTWKEVLEACVDAKEFRLGQMCGLNLISNADEIEDVLKTYERRGFFDQLITLMEAGVAATEAGGAGAAIFTELAILYAKFKPEKLMEHIKLYQSRFQLPKVIRECERHRHFSELNLLFMQHQEYDNAAGNMMEHPSVAWDHTQFKECLNKVANPEVYYRAINFYLNHQPQFLNEVLISQSKKIDHTRVVTTVVKEHKYIKEYMLQAQSNNIAALNEAINALLIDDEDYVALRTSVDTYDNFDQVALAVRLEKHELLEMRRISAHLYKRNGKFAQSVDLSKKDRIYKDAIEAASASKDAEVTETLLRFFVAEHQNECFAATLFTCYDFVRADLALELAWRNGIMDFAMPFFIQYTKEITSKVEAMDSASKKLHEEREKEKRHAEQMQPAALDPGMGGQLYLTAPGFDGGMGGMNPGMMNPGMMNPGMGGMGGMPGMGMGMGMGMPGTMPGPGMGGFNGGY